MTGVPWDPRLSSWLDRVESGWTDAGLSPLACGELRARLVEDLVQALTEGAPVDELLATEPTTFARDVAAATGYDVPPIDGEPGSTPASRPGPTRSPILAPIDDALSDLTEPVRFVVTAMAGLFLAAVVSWFVVPVVFGALDSMGSQLSQVVEGYAALGVWALLAMACAVVAGLAVRWQFRASPLRERATWSAVAALLVSGLLITPITVAFAWTTGYSTLPGVVLTEIALVLAGLVVGLAVAGHLVWRRTSHLGRVPHNAP